MIVLSANWLVDSLKMVYTPGRYVRGTAVVSRGTGVVDIGGRWWNSGSLGVLMPGNHSEGVGVAFPCFLDVWVAFLAKGAFLEVQVQFKTAASYLKNLGDQPKKNLRKT